MKEAAHYTGGWIVRYLRAQMGRFLLAAVAGVLAVGCGAALLFTSGYLISRSSLQPENVLMVYVPIVLVRTFGFGKAIVQYVEKLLSHDTVLRTVALMRQRLYRLLEPQALQLSAKYRSGDVLGMLVEDIERLQHLFLRLILPVLTATLLFAAGVAMLGRMDAMFALWMALYAGFFLFTLPVFAMVWMRVHRRRFVEERSLAYGELADAVYGMKDWMLSGRVDRFLHAFGGRQRRMSAAEKRLRRIEWKTQWVVYAAIGLGVVLMTMWAGGHYAGGMIEAEWIAAFALVAFPLLEAMAKAGESVLRVPEYRQSLDRLNRVAQTVPVDHREQKLAGDAVAMEQDIPVSLRLENVCFRYPGSDRFAVSDVSLHLPQGSKVALIGKSGSGKSTLLKLMQGELVPTHGRVTVNGMPVLHATRMRSQSHNEDDEAASSLFAVLNQKPYLFDTTMYHNIRLGRPQATEAEVRAAVAAAGLSELVASLPDGLDTRVREAGTRFSGGERQRIALARIWLQDRPLVLLDEPTLGLDPITEHELLQTIFRALAGKTLVWVTHHLAGMEQMERILLLEQGRIMLEGSHEQLLLTSERYRRLYALG